ncbi:chromate transporter [Massilia putida]|uniref:chromate transporter n=1 Tax=Massilia putida TaxID=1141883 RepID=UPI000950CF92|nr:chromate transporter [Massilia putida]
MNAPPRTDNTPRTDSAAPPDRPRPRSLSDLFVSFTLLALQGFGGVLAIVQREVVDRKGWLTQDEFIEDWAVAQIMPGPNVVNLSLMIGGRYFGFAGAMAALAGLLTVPLMLVLALVVLHDRFADSAAVAGALHGMAAVCAGLIGAAGLRLVNAFKKSPMPLSWCVAISAAGFILVAFLKCPLAWVLSGLGGLGCILTYRRLKA